MKTCLICLSIAALVTGGGALGSAAAGGHGVSLSAPADGSGVPLYAASDGPGFSLSSAAGEGGASRGFVDGFTLERCDIALGRHAQPGSYFDRPGRRCALLGLEDGSFEAWCYPLKLFRDFTFSFLLGASTAPIRAADIARRVWVAPEAAVITFVYQSFTVRAVYITPAEEPGALVLLDVDTTEPLSIVCSFVPELQPMWPAGLGGQAAFWDGELSAYVISEPTKKHHGIVGSPAAAGMSYTPAHMLADSPHQFRIDIDDVGAVRGKLIPVVIAGGAGTRDEIKERYRKLERNPVALYRRNVEYYRSLSERTMQVVTPDRELDLAFEWAKVSYENLFVDNPDLGFGMVAGLGPSGTSARPGFGWFFGGDAYINSLSLNSYGAFESTRRALEFTMRWQRDDGKMAHELSQGAALIDWFGDYPYGYIHADTSPYFIVACHDYFRWTGDADFLERSWGAVRRAYEWCRSTDQNGDALMDNSVAGLGALEYGTLTGIETDVYLAAVWARAVYAVRQLAVALGEDETAKEAHAELERVHASFDEKFWDEETGQYCYAFSPGGAMVREVTPWSAVAVMWGMGADERRLRSIQAMSSASLSTDWGVRSLSVESTLFEPLNYNYGAVWPFLSSFVAAAAYREGLPAHGYGMLMATVQHTFNNGLGHINEVFSGSRHIWPMESVPHQGFCMAGVVLPFVRGMLGIEGDAGGRTHAGRFKFEPKLPPDWERVRIGNCRFGGISLDLDYGRERGRIRLVARRRGPGGIRMIFAPALGAGARIIAATVNGEPVSPNSLRVGSQSIAATEHWEPARWPGTDAAREVLAPEIIFELSGADTVEVLFEPTVEIVPPRFFSRIGDGNRGLKIRDIRYGDGTLTVAVEGLSGHSYDLRIVNGELIESVSGARYRDGALHLAIPGERGERFSVHEIVIDMQR